MSFSPAAERNKRPILAILEALLPDRAVVLEIASGTGQHAAHVAAMHPDWTWQPSDGNPAALEAIAERTVGLANVCPPIELDVLAWPWPASIERPDAIFCANLLHITPWPTCAALMRGASRHLRPGGALVLYGPFIVDGEPLAPGNAAFDADLRRRDPAWGVRRLAHVVNDAVRAGLALDSRFDMPANNLVLVFRAV